MADDLLRRISRELLFTTFLGPTSGLHEPWILQRIADQLEEQIVARGEVLFAEGQPAEHLYFMNDGRIRLRADGHPDWVYEGRWVIGTTDSLLRRAHARTALVEKDARLFRIRADQWIELMEDSFEITTNALVGSAQGTLALHVRVGGDGGFLHTGQGNALVPADTLVDRALLLHELPMLRGAGVQEITDIARASDVIEVREGEWLWQPGAPPGATFAVAAGTVVVEHAKPRVAARFGPGSIVGGAVSLGDAAGAWSARAATDATVVTFSNELWFDQMEEHVDLARVAMGSLAIEREHLFDLLARETGEIVLR